MVDDSRLRIMDDRLTRQGEILEGLTTSCRKLYETQSGIRGTLELILERLNSIERRPTQVPDLNSDETGCSVCSINCECDICIGIDATSPGSAGHCVCSIDCECDICFKNDATSPGNEGLN